MCNGCGKTEQTEEYKKLFDKDTMDKVIWLRSETDLELFLGMDDYLQESVAIKIAAIPPIKQLGNMKLKINLFTFSLDTILTIKIKMI